ncbi:helix-loop-helix DNA-binding domain-containing protein [Amylocarpus encephaloides]|uniref:Helix-loop-helix DNA-binding domain-containing protein n=1 Tax=Amylocarpus encephaloides TaxID=45428 RepID=A0A9P7YDS0_9HELO|nr:helix-loop-helix DNA-binding domain-containing protein [Amylocarpus encephaloides]
MAITVRPEVPAVDYFSLNTQRPQNGTTTSPTFALDSSYYSDPALASSDDSTLPSPISADDRIFPSYGLPKQRFNSDLKSEQAFNFGTFEDWMRWDDPSDAALSPTTEFFPELKLEPVSPTIADLELPPSSTTHLSHINTSDDGAVFREDSISEEPLFQSPSSVTSPNMSGLPPREGLYSTPLSWSRPLPGSTSSSFNNVLSPQEASRLRDIAMPNRPQTQDQYPGSPNSASSPEAAIIDNRRKRKSSVEDDDEDDDEAPAGNSRHPPVKKTAHNMIEKRYRTNLNDKIAALRDSVPSLRVMSKKNSRGEDVEEDLQGLTPAHKLNKATVLSKATEYIAHLEKRNKYLTRENASLKSRVDAFEILVMSRQNGNVTNIQRQQRNSMSGVRPNNGYMM